VIIEVSGLVAKGAAERGRPAAVLRNVSFVWGSGVLAIMGTPFDGVSTLLAVLAGMITPRVGRASIEGRTPAEERARIAYVPLEASLPEAMRVEEVCDLAANIRKETPMPAAQRLAVLGLEGLARRPCRTLTMSEARSVLLALALTSPAPVVLVEEPLSALEPAAASRALEAIRARAATGASIIVTTASVRDATRVGDRLAIMTAGTLGPVHAAQPHVTGGVARIRLALPAESRPAALVAALADEADVASVDTAARTLLVAGKDLVAIAAAITRAVASSGIDVEAIEPQVTSLELLRRTPS
jgi:ABC-type multidrug transport system ATPase subunit